MITIGIDPGQGGGLAIYDSEENRLMCMAMPLKTATAKGRMTVHIQEACKFMDEASAVYQRKLRDKGYIFDCGVVENVSAMPKQGVSSSFNFGRSFGNVEALMAFYCHNIHYAAPAKWKKYFDLSPDKNDSITKATELFGPGCQDVFWPRKKDEGVAEAALLAYYGTQLSDIT